METPMIKFRWSGQVETTPELKYLSDEVDDFLDRASQLYHPKEVAKVLRHLARQYDELAKGWGDPDE